jgi:hypothetical protein
MRSEWIVIDVGARGLPPYNPLQLPDDFIDSSTLASPSPLLML